MGLDEHNVPPFLIQQAVTAPTLNTRQRTMPTKVSDVGERDTKYQFARATNNFKHFGVRCRKTSAKEPSQKKIKPSILMLTYASIFFMQLIYPIQKEVQ